MATGRWAIIHNHETIGYAVVPTPASLQWDGSGSLGIRSKVLAPLAASGSDSDGGTSPLPTADSDGVMCQRRRTLMPKVFVPAPSNEPPADRDNPCAGGWVFRLMLVENPSGLLAAFRGPHPA